MHHVMDVIQQDKDEVFAQPQGQGLLARADLYFSVRCWLRLLIQSSYTVQCTCAPPDWHSTCHGRMARLSWPGYRN